ncbi:unnamed protein product [Parnassius mnemosyne]|uniref:Uncharacterized protein n=1 Tax=Parnassius mnemosyne TaxID=213953 RepID=A0AAV1KRR5_9NEOP
MSTYIAGLICAIILAVFITVWIAYCMFCRERHKPEYYQRNIDDLRLRNFEIAQEQDDQIKKQITAGIFILPSRHKHHDDDYVSRPDYPESPAPHLQPNTERLIDILNDSPDEVHKSVSFDLDSSERYCSDV